jgi:hypothetical protein
MEAGVQDAEGGVVSTGGRQQHLIRQNGRLEPGE